MKWEKKSEKLQSQFLIEKKLILQLLVVHLQKIFKFIWIRQIIVLPWHLVSCWLGNLEDLSSSSWSYSLRDERATSTQQLSCAIHNSTWLHIVTIVTCKSLYITDSIIIGILDEFLKDIQLVEYCRMCWLTRITIHNPIFAVIQDTFIKIYSLCV